MRIDLLKMVLSVFIITFMVSFISKNSYANGPRCCWYPVKSGLTGDFKGTVVTVKNLEKQIMMDYKHQNITFQFDDEHGSLEQKYLLENIKPGDKITGKEMDINGQKMYHLIKE